MEGLAAFLLSVKRRPTIRHQRSSEVSRRVAEDVWRLAYEQEPGLFDFRRSDGGDQSVVNTHIHGQHSYSRSHFNPLNRNSGPRYISHSQSGYGV